MVASAPKAFEKLDQKRQTLHKLKGVLAQKLEEKQNKKEKKLLKQNAYTTSKNNNNNNRSASAMMVERPDSRQSNQERCSSAMTILNKASNKSNYGIQCCCFLELLFYSSFLRTFLVQCF